VKTLIRSYSVVLIAATVFSVSASAGASDTPRESRPLVQGFVLATDSCQLSPVSFSEICNQTVVPIAGELRLRSVEDSKLTRIELNSSGIFTRKLEPGLYRVRLIEPRVAEKSLKRSAYRIYPSLVKIRATAKASVSDVDQSATQANIFIVAHKSRGVPPLVGIDYGIGK